MFYLVLLSFFFLALYLVCTLSCYLVLLCFLGFYLVLPSFIHFECFYLDYFRSFSVLPSYTEFCRVELGLSLVLSGFQFSFSYVPSFTGFLLVYA